MEKKRNAFEHQEAFGISLAPLTSRRFAVRMSLLSRCALRRGCVSELYWIHQSHWTARQWHDCLWTFLLISLVKGLSLEMEPVGWCRASENDLCRVLRFLRGVSKGPSLTASEASEHRGESHNGSLKAHKTHKVILCVTSVCVLTA